MTKISLLSQCAWLCDLASKLEEDPNKKRRLDDRAKRASQKHMELEEAKEEKSMGDHW